MLFTSWNLFKFLPTFSSLAPFICQSTSFSSINVFWFSEIMLMNYLTSSICFLHSIFKVLTYDMSGKILGHPMNITASYTLMTLKIIYLLYMSWLTSEQNLSSLVRQYRYFTIEQSLSEIVPLLLSIFLFHSLSCSQYYNLPMI